MITCVEAPETVCPRWFRTGEDSDGAPAHLLFQAQQGSSWHEAAEGWQLLLKEPSCSRSNCMP